jgi:hypothetical protein
VEVVDSWSALIIVEFDRRTGGCSLHGRPQLPGVESLATFTKSLGAAQFEAEKKVKFGLTSSQQKWRKLLAEKCYQRISY